MEPNKNMHKPRTDMAKERKAIHTPYVIKLEVSQTLLHASSVAITRDFA